MKNVNTFQIPYYYYYCCCCVKLNSINPKKIRKYHHSLKIK